MAGNKQTFMLVFKARLYFYPLPADEEIETLGSQGFYTRSYVYCIEKLNPETNTALIENTYFIQNKVSMYESFQDLTWKHESGN